MVDEETFKLKVGRKNGLKETGGVFLKVISVRQLLKKGLIKDKNVRGVMQEMDIISEELMGEEGHVTVVNLLGRDLLIGSVVNFL